MEHRSNQQHHHRTSHPPALAPRPTSASHHHHHQQPAAITASCPLPPALAPIQASVATTLQLHQHLLQQQQRSQVPYAVPLPPYASLPPNIAAAAAAAAAASPLPPLQPRPTPQQLPPHPPTPPHHSQQQQQQQQSQLHQVQQHHQQQQLHQHHQIPPVSIWSRLPALRPAPCVPPPRLLSAPQLPSQPAPTASPASKQQQHSHHQLIAAKPQSVSRAAINAAHQQSNPAFIQPAHVTKTVYSDVISLSSNSNNVVYDLSKKSSSAASSSSGSGKQQAAQNQQSNRLPISPRVTTATAQLPVCRVPPLQQPQQQQQQQQAAFGIHPTAIVSDISAVSLAQMPLTVNVSSPSIISVIQARPVATTGAASTTVTTVSVTSVISSANRSSAFRPIAPYRQQQQQPQQQHQQQKQGASKQPLPKPVVVQLQSGSSSETSKKRQQQQQQTHQSASASAAAKPSVPGASETKLVDIAAKLIQKPSAKLASAQRSSSSPPAALTPSASSQSNSRPTIFVNGVSPGSLPRQQRQPSAQPSTPPPPPPPPRPPSAPIDFDKEIQSLDPHAQLNSRLCRSPASVGEDLIWQDDCGYLPGTSLRFRKTNGILELLEDDFTDEDDLRSRHTSADRDSSGSTVPMVIDDRHLSMSGLMHSANANGSQQQNGASLGEQRFVCRSCGSEGQIRGSLDGAGEYCTESCSKLTPIATNFINNNNSCRKRKRSGENGQQLQTIEQQHKRRFQICQVDVEQAGKYHAPNGVFLWKKYLKDTDSQAAPERFFSTHSYLIKNRMAEFEVGMVLEGVDPCHESLICCLSISEIQGCRLRLHFEGYTELHDFWCAADSPFLFPVGWSNHNGFPLQPPRGFEPGKFNWFDYVITNKLRAVPRRLFSVPWDLPLPDHGFSEGQKLEAVDPRNPDHICVATVAMVMGNRICVHFDGWDNTYDFWTKVDSPTIHPVGWCEQHDRALSLPEEWCRQQAFTWDRYLESTCSEPVMPAAFRPRQPVPFSLGMKLEFVDPRNTRLIRVGTVVDPSPYPGFLQILPDGWGEKFAFITLDSSLDLLPVGYCSRTGHPLEPLPTWHDSEKFTCPTVGCRGLGHVKGPGYKSHSSIKSCPYAERNWHRDLPDRLELEPPVTDESGSYGNEQNKQQPTDQSRSNTNLNGRSNKRLSQSSTVHQHQQHPQPAPSPGCPFYRSVFSPSVFPYDPCKDTGPLVWPEHTQLIPSLAGIEVSEVPRWTVAETSDLVRRLPGCEPFADAFIVEEIDGDAFLHLQQVDLLSVLKMPLGPAIKLAQAIAAIRDCLEQP